MGVLPPTQDPGTPTPELRELLETMAELPRGANPQMKEFSADSAGKARGAATEWLRDFSNHGAIEIHSIRTTAYRDKFVAVIAYWAA
jgi:hypothetical protein